MAAYLEIEKVIGREILDSRGNPTVEPSPMAISPQKKKRASG